MKRRLNNLLLTTTAIFAVFLAATTSNAQNRAKSSSTDGASGSDSSTQAKPTPRMSDGHPDLSGVYFPGTADPDKFRLGQLNGPNRKFAKEFEKPPFQPWVLEKSKLMGNLDRADPEIGCAPPGAPGFFYKGNYAIKMIQNPKELVILSEIFTTYRIIHTDGRQHPKPEDIYPLFMGDAIGHWEGDTLVVDLVGVDTHTWVAGSARPAILCQRRSALHRNLQAAR